MPTGFSQSGSESFLIAISPGLLDAAAINPFNLGKQRKIYAVWLPLKVGRVQSGLAGVPLTWQRWDARGNAASHHLLVQKESLHHGP